MLQNIAQMEVPPSDLHSSGAPRFSDRKSLPNRRGKIAEPRDSSIVVKQSKPNRIWESTEPRFSPFAARRSMPNRRSIMTRDYDPFTNGYLLNANLPISHRSETEFIVEKIHSENSEHVWLKRLQASHWSKSDLLSPFTLFEMASSSESGPTVEAKIDSFETSLGRLRARLDQEDKLLQESN